MRCYSEQTDCIRHAAGGRSRRGSRATNAVAAVDLGPSSVDLRAKTARWLFWCRGLRRRGSLRHTRQSRMRYSPPEIRVAPTQPVTGESTYALLQNTEHIGEVVRPDTELRV